MIVLIDMKNKNKVIEMHNYSMDEFIKQYGGFCSLKTKNGIIVGDVHPELIWVELNFSPRVEEKIEDEYKIEW